MVPPKGEHCTQVLEANLGDIIEIRFVGAENPRVDKRRLMWTYHTAHLHGYDMFLLDMGFPVTNKTGQIMKMNSVLSCQNEACTVHEWNEKKILKGMGSLENYIAAETIPVFRDPRAAWSAHRCVNPWPYLLLSSEMRRRI